MKKNYFVVLLVLLMVMCVGITFIACENVSHTHTFATEWSWDETYHWKEATCEHKNEISSKAEHNFVDNQCTVCGYRINGGSDQNIFTVTFDSQGGTFVESVTAVKNSLIQQPNNPTKDFYVFDGWFKDKDCTERWWFDIDKITSSITLYAKWVFLDNGHSIKASDDFEFINDTTLSYNNMIRHGTQRFDLRNKFEVSDGAEWRAFGTPECLQSTEIISRTIDLVDGWNEVYILVENSTTYDQTVYTMRVYRNRILSVPIYYNETVQYATIGFEENVAASETEDARLPKFTLSQYSSDDKYYTDKSYATEWTNNEIITESTAIYIRAYCNAVNVNSEGTITGMPEQPGSVHLVIPDKVAGQTTKTIASKAFKDVNNIIAVNFPNTLVAIGEDAFVGTPFYNNSTNWNNDSLYCDNVLLDIKSFSDEYSILPGTRLIAGGVFYKSTIMEITMPDSVISIGPSAFYQCSSLINAEISENVKYIGDSAFRGCTSLINITIPLGITYVGSYAFSGCSGITTLTLESKDQLTSIGSSAFSYCDNLINLTVKENSQLTSIGASAFSYCNNLTNVTIEGNSKLTSIGASAFSYCDNLTNVTIEGNRKLTSIGAFAFSYCYNLTSMTIPFVGASKNRSNNTHFGYIFGAINSSENTKYVPSSLHTVILTDATSIKAYAFGFCVWLKKVVIPNSVTSVADLAFFQSYNLVIYCEATTKPSEWGTMPPSTVWNCNNNEVADDGFVYTIINNIQYAFKNSNACIEGEIFVGNLDNFVIPTSVEYKNTTYYITSIGNYAFYGCGSLTSITIPNGVTSIGRSAFEGCYGLTEITIPSSVTSVGVAAFKNCNKLTSIIIPDGVESIEEETFRTCYGLTEIIIPSSVTSIGSSAFSSARLEMVYYCGTKEDWSDIDIEFGNTSLTSAIVYYYSDELTEEQKADSNSYWRYVDGVPTVWEKGTI